MKNNKVLIIIAIILLNVLAICIIGQSLMSNISEYDAFVNEGKAYYEKELCSKAIDSYNEALAIEDTIELRLEMLNVYDKGMNIGEFTDNGGIIDLLADTLELYRENNVAYETACKYYISFGMYEECAEALMKARDLNVSSDAITEYREQVRYKYESKYSMYETLLPCCDGFYTATIDNEYIHLNEDSSRHSSNSYLFLSPMSDGYAFAKAAYPNGETRNFLINQEGQRQLYVDDIEASSGVAKVTDANGEDTYLLSGKVGDKYKYFDISGKEVFGEYLFAGRFRNNVAAVKEAEGKWKLIDPTGKAIVDTAFTDVILNELDECAPKGIIIANDGSGYHLYNHKGEKIGDFTCDEAKAFVDSYAAFKSGEKWGFVDMEGKVVIEAQYDDAKSFSNKLGAVKTGALWSLINPKGEVVSEETFEDVDYLNSKGFCFIKNGGHWSSLEFYYTGE